jgi:hypothetical protein
MHRIDWEGMEWTKSWDIPSFWESTGSLYEKLELLTFQKYPLPSFPAKLTLITSITSTKSTPSTLPKDPVARENYAKMPTSSDSHSSGRTGSRTLQ